MDKNKLREATLYLAHQHEMAYKFGMIKVQAVDTIIKGQEQAEGRRAWVREKRKYKKEARFHKFMVLNLLEQVKMYQ